MEVSCPKCNSRFNLPDSVVKNGVKLRCTVCSNVFTLELGSASVASPESLNLAAKPKEQPKKSKKKLLIMAACACLVLGVVLFLLWQFVLKGDGDQAKSDLELAEKVKLLTMRNVRQYIVDNEKVGKVFVIEGKVVNEFPTPKELIAVEGAIYGKDKRLISIKKQRCGTQLSLFQLQVLSEKEMEAFLNNKMEILTNNINLKQGAEVPFMILFYGPPEDVSEFGVRIVDVRDVPAMK